MKEFEFLKECTNITIQEIQVVKFFKKININSN